MAEAFGIAAGAVGFVSLLGQVNSGINKLRAIIHSAETAPDEIQSVARQLEFLFHIMQKTHDKTLSKIDPALQHCQTNCDQIVKDLDDLNKILEAGSKANVRGKVSRIVAFRDWKEKVENLERSIQRAQLNLILLNSCHQDRVQWDQDSLIERFSASIAQALSQDRDQTASEGLWLTPSTRPSQSPSVSTQTDNRYVKHKFKLRRDCISRCCSCICHKTERTSGYFWALEYTLPPIFRRTCNRKSCNVAKYGGTFRLALSQLGIKRAAIIQLYIVTTPGKYSIRPAINFEEVVPYTSPGFVILWKLRHLMISFEDGREQLVNLYKTDRIRPDHVDPSGKSYIENLVMTPAGSPVERKYRYKLLELFMGEFEMTRGTETSTFLSRCAHWIGEAPHLELLEILLSLGFNAAEINIHDWPEPCSPDWFAPDIAEDPFFIEYLQLLCKDNQGFAEMSALHEAVLFESPDSVQKWILRFEKDQRNALGQTPLHLATMSPDHLRILIDAGYDLDARDNYGITPLMYAAATNQEEAVMMLIEAGSDLNATDFNWNRNFMYYAGLRQHWNLILKILNTIEKHIDRDAAENWARFATILFLVIFPDRLEISGVSLNQLLAKCGTVNFLYDARNDRRNRCLLHDIRSPAEFDALLANGFRLVDHVDSEGQSPLMAAADRCDSILVDRLLAYEADINRKDNFQRASLCYALQRREASFICYSTFRAMKTLRILLENNADVLTRDACRCPCSPEGCLPTIALQHNSWTIGRTRVPLWSLEWLSLVSEHKGESEAKITLLSFIRRAKHDEMGVTHVCCRREQSYLFQYASRKASPNERIDQILNEESLLIKDLESEMDRSTRKEYNALLEDWILHIKVSLDAACIKAARQETAYSVIRPNLEVDHHNDTFVYSVEACRMRDPKNEATSHISEYVYWLEQEYSSGHPSKMNACMRESWYRRRLSWLYRLSCALSISSTDLTAAMSNLQVSSEPDQYDPLNIEEGVRHFCSKWAELEEDS